MDRQYFPDREVYKENYVHFVGMVYAENRRAKGDGETEIYNRTDKESKTIYGNRNISTEVKNANKTTRKIVDLRRNMQIYF